MIKNIGIDITDLDPNYYGGSDTYSNGLIDGLIKNNSKHTYQVYLRKNYFENRRLYKSKKIKYLIFEYTLFEKIMLKLYNRLFPVISIITGDLKYKIDYVMRNLINQRLTNLISKNSEILMVPNVLLPSYNLKIKSILNIQDIQHLHYPNFFSAIEKLRRNYLYNNSIKYSSSLIFSSNFIKKDVMKHFDVKKKNMTIIPEGINLAEFTKINKYKKYKFKNYFFFPAQLWKHKNHLLVIKAFNYFNKKNDFKYTLIMCGKSFISSKDILNKIMKCQNCHYLGVIDKSSLINLYRNSIATISPALYESSSLTILEALACGSKIIASKTEPNLERKKFNVLYFNKNSYKDLAKQFKNSLKKTENKVKKNEIKRFDWKNISKEWLEKSI